MKRFTAMIAVEGSSSVDRCDGIEYDGRSWLVPYWLEPAGGEWRQPERIVPLDHLPGVQEANFAGASFVVGVPIPKTILFGAAPPELIERYGVILSPPIRIETKRKLN